MLRIEIKEGVNYNLDGLPKSKKTLQTKILIS